jgi:hypothetical protein
VGWSTCREARAKRVCKKGGGGHSQQCGAVCTIIRLAVGAMMTRGRGAHRAAADRLVVEMFARGGVLWCECGSVRGNSETRMSLSHALGRVGPQARETQTTELHAPPTGSPRGQTPYGRCITARSARVSTQSLYTRHQQAVPGGKRRTDDAQPLGAQRQASSLESRRPQPATQAIPPAK